MTESARLEELKRRVDRDPASISFAALAEEYRRLGRFVESIETCRAGLLRHPSYLSARVTLGRALVEMGEFDAASDELELVLRTAPENLAAIRALAEIHRRRSEIPETVEQYGDHEQAETPSTIAPVAVQSIVVSAQPPALAGLEAFLVAIQRARRDVPAHAAR